MNDVEEIAFSSSGVEFSFIWWLVVIALALAYLILKFKYEKKGLSSNSQNLAHVSLDVLLSKNKCKILRVSHDESVFLFLETPEGLQQVDYRQGLKIDGKSGLENKLTTSDTLEK